VQLSFNGNNQISTSGYRYDAAGNLVIDGTNCYTYDAENRITSVAPQTSGVCGRRHDELSLRPRGQAGGQEPKRVDREAGLIRFGGAGNRGNKGKRNLATRRSLRRQPPFGDVE